MSKAVKIMLCIVLAVVLLIGGILIFTAVSKNKAPNWEDQYHAGIEHLEEGNYDAALTALIAAVEIEPARYEAYVAQGDAYMGLERFREARSVYQTAYMLAPEAQNAIREKLKLAWNAISAGTVPIAVTEETVPETTVAETNPVVIVTPEKRYISRIETLYNGEITTEDVFTYDDSGNILQKTTSGYNNGEKTYSVVTEYVYDDDGFLAGIKEENSPVSEYEYHYDLGVLSGYTYNEVRGDVIASSVTYQYERDESGNIVKVTTTSSDPELWTNGEYRYDDLGRCVSANEHERYGDHEFKRTMTYDYSNMGSVIVTKEETMLDNTSTTRTVQFGDMEYGYIYGSELYEGYSVVTDMDGYIVGVKDSDGQLVNFFEYCTPDAQDTDIPKETSPEKITFADIPSEFVLAGAGAWRTVLTIHEDGSFVGEYSDSDMGVTGEGYPRGTVSICNFEGKFSEPQKVDEFIYSTKLESYKIADTLGREYYEDEIRYIVTESAGMYDADEFYIYLPGAAIKGDLRESYMYSMYLYKDIRSILPSGFYYLYNVGGDTGFPAYCDDFVRRNDDYDYKYMDREVHLGASYYGTCRLVFWPKIATPKMNLEFVWREENQTEFRATDYYGSGDYHISLYVSEDLSAVKVKLTSINGVDLSEWGGTTDGYFEAVFVNE